eukprot:6198061-Pleurochrysis_carterae.AAC.2
MLPLPQLHPQPPYSPQPAQPQAPEATFAAAATPTSSSAATITARTSHSRPSAAGRAGVVLAHWPLLERDAKWAVHRMVLDNAVVAAADGRERGRDAPAGRPRNACGSPVVEGCEGRKRGCAWERVTPLPLPPGQALLKSDTKAICQGFVEVLAHALFAVTSNSLIASFHSTSRSCSIKPARPCAPVSTSVSAVGCTPFHWSKERVSPSLIASPSFSFLCAQTAHAKITQTDANDSLRCRCLPCGRRRRRRR